MYDCTPHLAYFVNKFAGKERDAESNLDYFGARHYASSLGRFMTPDDGSDQDARDPQGWNLYSYVRNNPLNSTDPSGHSHCVQTDNQGTLHCYADKEWDRMQQAQEIQKEMQMRMYADIVGQSFGHARNMLAFSQYIDRHNGLAVVGGYSLVAGFAFSTAEQSIADVLEAEGSEVVPLDVVPGEVSPDALVNGVKTEFKTVTVAGPNTLKNQIQDGLKQAPNVVVDVRGTSITKAQALQQVQRVEGNMGSVQGRVTILTNEGAVKH